MNTIVQYLASRAHGSSSCGCSAVVIAEKCTASDVWRSCSVVILPERVRGWGRETLNLMYFTDIILCDRYGVMLMIGDAERSRMLKNNHC